MGGPWLKRLLSRAAGLSLYWLAGLPTHDATNNFRLYDAALVNELGIDSVGGFEVALEGLLTNSNLKVLALFDKPDPLDGPFFEETIYTTPSRLSAGVQEDIARCISTAAASLGLREGAVHAELRVNDQGPWMLEIAGQGLRARAMLDSAGSSEEGFLQPLSELVSRGQTRAEELLALYHGEWQGDLSRLFEAYNFL